MSFSTERPPSADFGSLAATYDSLRPADENWLEVARLLVREGDLGGRRVLDIGCGTGRFVALLATEQSARAWGVDPTREMLEVARARSTRGVGFKLGRAESLPFKDGWFERASMWLVAHLVDRPAAFREARRVLSAGGRFALATFDPAYFDGYWLNRLFPSLEQLDRARFPTRASLPEELAAAGFGDVRLHDLHQRATIDRAAALERIDGRFISTLRLLDDDEFRRGRARAERELPELIEYEVDWLVAVAAV
jgi:ubiquinone/menaquinone biosynthesis C-methylase UbiE